MPFCRNAVLVVLVVLMVFVVMLAVLFVVLAEVFVVILVIVIVVVVVVITAGSPYVDGAYRRGERGSDSGAWLNCLTVVAAGLVVVVGGLSEVLGGMVVVGHIAGHHRYDGRDGGDGRCHKHGVGRSIAGIEDKTLGGDTEVEIGLCRCRSGCRGT